MRTPRIPALVAIVLAFACAATTLAASPPRLSGPVTDAVDVLGGEVEAVEAALADLLDSHDIQLFVLFVDTTEDLSVFEFIDETARLNSLGVNDALLVVALDDRTDAIWISDGLEAEITDEELDSIIAGTLEPALGDGDFAGAAIATAIALGEAVEPEPIPTPAPTPEATPTPPDAGGSGTNDGIDVGLVVGVLLLVAGAVILGAWLFGRLGAMREAEERDRRTGKLAREANALLIATDERIRTADQEAGFVEAEFGEAEAKPFRAAITEAREELRAAFGIRQRLDDAEPEDPPTREALLNEILERCGRAGAALDRQAARIDELRNLERNAPTILAGLPALVEAQERRLSGAETTLDELGRYAESTWASVTGNATEARKGLAGARAAIERGIAAVGRAEGRAEGRPDGQAASRAVTREILTAQEGIAGATALLDGIDKLATSVREDEAGLADELRAAATDLADARAAVGTLDPGAASGHDRTISAAEEALRSASAAAATVPLDPRSAYRLAAAARRGSGDVLAAVRRDAAQQAQLAAALAASISSARADVDRAADFIATRRSGVGRRARTRLAEAERLLEAAISARDSDPKAAIEQAREAERRAEEAYSLAATDFDGWNRGGPSPTGTGGGTGSDIAGAILGGIIGGILSGGGRGGGGWGGSPWGSSGPSGGGGGGGGWGGGGGGHSRGGGFGGGGGGGGGGGHSRGGRW
ncbi:MAG: TPM domain-containing protein [Chloroflexota bacterium]|nr:MAG: TPM domain-containing protein [Chloroflexota bacterium]